MATTVGQHGVAAFTNPSNGDALDATVVKGNDNTLRSAYVDHDLDPGIHVQSSLLAARPAAGTAGRKWMTVDIGAVKLWYDDGSTWQEVNYVPSSGDITFTGANITFTNNVDVGGNLTLAGNATIGNTTSDTCTLNARVSSNAIPSVNNSYDLGSSTLKWRNLYATDVVVSGGIAASTLSGSLNASSVSAGTFGSGAFAFQTTLGVGTTLSANDVNVLSTLTSGRVFAGRNTVSGSGGTISLASYNHHRVTMTGSGTLTLTNGVTGGVYTLEVLQDSTGGRTVTWGTGIVWPGGTTPAGTTTANRKDVYTFFYDGSKYLGVQFGANYDSTG